MVQQEAAAARVLHGIVEATARHLGGDPSAIDGDANFFDLGADSLQMISVLRELEQQHQVRVTMRQLLEETGTPRRLAEFIVAHMPETVQRAEPTCATESIAPRATTTAPAPAPAPAPEPAPAPTPAPSASDPEPAPAPSVSDPEPAPAATPSAPAPAYATREELEDLADKIQQMSRIQLQMMSQLSQLLALQTASVTDRLNGRVVK